MPSCIKDWELSDFLIKFMQKYKCMDDCAENFSAAVHALFFCYISTLFVMDGGADSKTCRDTMDGSKAAAQTGGRRGD